MALTIYSASTSPLGQSIYTFVGVAAPAQFVPRLYATTKRNKAGSNIDYDIRVTYPLVTEVDGVWQNKNTIRLSLNFTALQNVMADTEKTRVIDEVISYLTTNKAKIVAGNVTPAGG